MKLRNKVTTWLLLMVMFLGFCPSVYAAQSDSQTVRVAVIDYKNFIQMNEDGSVSGYAYEYLQDIQKITGWNYEFIEMSFADASAALQNGEIDLLAGNQYVESRAELYDFSKRDMGQGGTVLCVMPDNMSYCYNDYASYGGMKIAGLRGSIRIEQTKEALSKYGVSADFILYDTDAQSKAAMENGEVDAVLMSSIRCEDSYKILARFDTAPLYFCTNKKRPELKEQIDLAMEQIELNSPYYKSDLDKKYYGELPIQLAFTEEEKTYIKNSDPITVAITPDMKPLEYYDKSDKTYHGVVPDVYDLIAEYSGLSFVYVEREQSEVLKQQLATGEVQILASLANSQNNADDWGVSLTNSYFENSIARVTNANSSDKQNADMSVVIRSGFPYFEVLATDAGYTDISYADTFDECMRLVNSGAVDMTYLPSDCATSTLNSTKSNNVNHYLIPRTLTSYSMGVAADQSPLLLSILNKSLATITPAEESMLFTQNLTLVNQKDSFYLFMEQHKVTILMVLLLLALVIVAAVSYVVFAQRRLNRSLQKALEAADLANQAKTDFLSRMSHDMRTPMNAIMGLTALSLDVPNLPAEITENLSNIQRSGEFLLGLVNDVLDMSKIEHGKMELQYEPYPYADFQTSMKTMFEPLCAQKGIKLQFEEVTTSLTVLTDKVRLNQVFFNIMSNAVKFTPSGGTVSYHTENLQRNGNRGSADYIITDTGCGMSEVFQKNVFEPFEQEHTEATAHLQGTGLGIPIAKNIVELMGGTLTIQSELGVGTSVRIHLSFEIVPDQESMEKPKQRNENKPARLQGKKILLVEDHPLNAQIAKKLLEKVGAEIELAENGKIGLEKFKNSSVGYYDVILMDIRMPVMNGLEATAAIRSLDKADAKTIPIIAMTANAYADDIRECLEAGMNAHTSKPIDPVSMYETIAKYMSNENKS